MRVCWARLIGTLTLVGSVCSACPKERPEPERWRRVAQAQDPALVERQKRVRAERNKRKMRRLQDALIKEADRACTKDADCTLVPYHCCSCTHGGKMSAVNNEKLPGLIRRRTAGCEEAVCPAVVSTDPSCSAKTARCAEGICVPVVDNDGAVQGVGVEEIAEDKDPPGQQPTAP